MFRLRSIDREPRVKLRLGYDFLSVFSGWYEGQGDPLYAVISRRGNSVDWVELEVTLTELAILIDTAQHIIEHAAELLGDRESAADVRVAQRYLPEWQNLLEVATLEDDARGEQMKLLRRRGLSG